MVEPVAAILPLKELGWDTKRIARELGVIPGPVKRYLEAGRWQRSRSRSAEAAVARCCAPWR
jgi:hypothetical protein